MGQSKYIQHTASGHVGLVLGMETGVGPGVKTQRRYRVQWSNGLLDRVSCDHCISYEPKVIAMEASAHEVYGLGEALPRKMKIVARSITRSLKRREKRLTHMKSCEKWKGHGLMSDEWAKEPVDKWVRLRSGSVGYVVGVTYKNKGEKFYKVRWEKSKEGFDHPTITEERAKLLFPVDARPVMWTYNGMEVIRNTTMKDKQLRSQIRRMVARTHKDNLPLVTESNDCVLCEGSGWRSYNNGVKTACENCKGTGRVAVLKITSKYD